MVLCAHTVVFSLSLSLTHTYTHTDALSSSSQCLCLLAPLWLSEQCVYWFVRSISCPGSPSASPLPALKRALRETHQHIQAHVKFWECFWTLWDIDKSIREEGDHRDGPFAEQSTKKSLIGDLTHASSSVCTLQYNSRPEARRCT